MTPLEMLRAYNAAHADRAIYGIIGQATDKRPGAQGRRGTYDVYEVAGERVHLRLREFLRPDGTVEPLNGLRTDAIWVSRHRYHVHVNRARTWQS